jgi:hypothetical protein
MGRNHDDFRKGGRVSIWIGNFRSEEELDAYMNLDRQFEKDFDFNLNETDMPEVIVFDSPIPIAKLAEGFSWSDSYKDAAASVARERGITQATTMVMFLNFEFLPDKVRLNPTAPLQFLAAVSFS